MLGANLGAHKALLHRIEKTPVLLEPNFKERKQSCKQANKYVCKVKSGSSKQVL